MNVVWWVFETLALLLAAGGMFSRTRAGAQAPVFRIVGRWLLVLAGVTAAYPTLLGPLGTWIWAGGYAVTVAALTVVMTAGGIRAARRLAAPTA